MKKLRTPLIIIIVLLAVATTTVFAIRLLPAQETSSTVDGEPQSEASQSNTALLTASLTTSATPTYFSTTTLTPTTYTTPTETSTWISTTTPTNTNIPPAVIYPTFTFTPQKYNPLLTSTVTNTSTSTSTSTVTRTPTITSTNTVTATTTKTATATTVFTETGTATHTHTPTTTKTATTVFTETGTATNTVTPTATSAPDTALTVEVSVFYQDCDTLTFKVTVSNTGERSHATNVIVTNDITKGGQYVDNIDPVTLNFGDIPPGTSETQIVDVNLNTDWYSAFSTEEITLQSTVTNEDSRPVHTVGRRDFATVVRGSNTCP